MCMQDFSNTDFFSQTFDQTPKAKPQNYCQVFGLKQSVIYWSSYFDFELLSFL